MPEGNDDKKDRYVSLRNVAVFLPALLGLLAYYVNRSYSVTDDPLLNNISYREACLSGRYSSLKDLHPFITDYVEEIEGTLSREQFIDDYLWRGKPLLMKGAARDWPAHTTWTDEYLHDTFHDIMFYVDLRKHHSTDYGVRRKMKLGKFISHYKRKDWYLDSMTADPRFLDETHVPEYLNISAIFDKEGSSFFHNFYLSGGDTNSPLHYDGYDNLLTSLDGTKEWIIAEPAAILKLRFDEWVDHPNLAPLNVTNFNISEHLGLCDVTWRRAIVTPGDTLYVPTRWPHHVYSPPSRNMALGMWFYLEAYMGMVPGIDEDENQRNHSATIPMWVDHVKQRPRLCEVANCTTLPPGTLRTILSLQQDTTYSRDTDVPPPASISIKISGDRTLRIPTIAYGTGVPGGSILNPYVNIKAALNMGYKFIDTAQMYGNEAEAGAAIRDSRWVRKSVILLTKFELAKLKGSNITQAVEDAINRSLKDLGLEYIDILLIHDTDANTLEQISEAWRAMETSVKDKKVQAIGLSNVDVDILHHLFYKVATIPISLVQNLYSPLEMDKEALAFCFARGIAFMGFGVTGAVHAVFLDIPNPVLENPIIHELADIYHTSPQVLLYNWAAQQKVIPIARSTRLSHMADNLTFRDIFLTSAHINLINQLEMSEDELYRMWRPLDTEK